MLPLYNEKIYNQYELFATFLQSIKLTLHDKLLSIADPTYFKETIMSMESSLYFLTFYGIKNFAQNTITTKSLLLHRDIQTQYDAFLVGSIIKCEYPNENNSLQTVYLLLSIYESYKDFIYDSVQIWKTLKLDKECMYKILELFRNGDRLFFYNISGITNITLHSNEIEKKQAFRAIEIHREIFATINTFVDTQNRSIV